mmetsp:Transcript_10112/g.35211  ORF Transcript_10112/g.35211 Transcript_10112/m.35211 type:complete len:242 (-) Transcript_10112:109-834(-)
MRLRPGAMLVTLVAACPAYDSPLSTRLRPWATPAAPGSRSSRRSMAVRRGGGPPPAAAAPPPCCRTWCWKSWLCCWSWCCWRRSCCCWSCCPSAARAFSWSWSCCRRCSSSAWLFSSCCCCVRTLRSCRLWMQLRRVPRKASTGWNFTHCWHARCGIPSTVHWGWVAWRAHARSRRWKLWAGRHFSSQPSARHATGGTSRRRRWAAGSAGGSAKAAAGRAFRSVCGPAKPAPASGPETSPA